MLYFICDSMKKLKILLIIFLIIILIPLSINFYVIFKNIKIIYNSNDINENYDIALILGCSVLRNNTPSKMLKDRLNKGIELYTNKKVSQILISGDHSDSYSEVEVMYKYLIFNGVSESDILIDYKGYSTSDSLINYEDIYKEKSVIIVTQNYHLYRALYIASELDLNATGVYAKKENYNGFIFREIREILARNKDFFKFLFI